MTDATDFNSYIVTKRFGDQPHIRDRRVRVADIVRLGQDNNWANDQLAHELALTEVEVRAALNFYEENQGSIENQIARDPAAAL